MEDDYVATTPVWWPTEESVLYIDIIITVLLSNHYVEGKYNEGLL